MSPEYVKSEAFTNACEILCVQPHELAEIILLIREMQHGRKKFGAYNTRHEALGVILEEFDEFVEAIRSDILRDARKEARQLSAVALRFCCEFCDDGDTP